MLNKLHVALLAALMYSVASIAFVGCTEQSSTNNDNDAEHSHDDHDHDHSHDGHDHDDDHEHDHDEEDGHDHDDDDHEHGDDDHHDEVSIGSTKVGDMTVECWQSHGEVEPGKELHLVVKLPYNDDGASVVRAWIGTDDRLSSMVARGDYAASHDDYNLHAEAPDPLPEGAQWWIEVTKPDGTKSVGSIDYK